VARGAAGRRYPLHLDREQSDGAPAQPGSTIGAISQDTKVRGPRAEIRIHPAEAAAGAAVESGDVVRSVRTTAGAVLAGVREDG
jgi:hypothetical protein